MKRKTLSLLILACATGVAFAQQATLTEPQVRAKLEAQGYTKVNDVKFEDGVWKADAKSADGNHVDVRLDAKTGAVIGKEKD
jgi:uncharacterized membrane protein YkoI